MTTQAGYYKIPRWLMGGRFDAKLSATAILMFGVIESRIALSGRGDTYKDEDGVYCMYTMDDLAVELCCTKKTAIGAKRQLIDAGLIKTKSAGIGGAHRIYIGDAVPKEDAESKPKPKKKSTKKQKIEPSAGEIEVIDTWNGMAEKNDLKTEQHDDKEAVKAVRQMLSLHTVEDLKDAIQKVGETDWLTGRTANFSGWKATLGWLSKEKNYKKVIGGAYGESEAQRRAKEEAIRKKNEDELMIRWQISDVQEEWNRFIKRLKLESTDSHEQLEDYLRRLGSDSQILQAIRKMESMDSEDVKELFDGKPISIDTMLSESIYTQLAA